MIEKTLEIKKLDYIDAVRGVAVLLVILVHTLTFLDRGGLNSIFRIGVEQGRMGVQLFYMASAFTLFYSLSERNKIISSDNNISTQKKNENKNSSLEFFIRRFFRIAPMFYIATIYYFYFYINFPDPLSESSNLTVFTLPNLLSHFTFTHGLSPFWINSIVPGGWSVGVEFIFYLFVPALYFTYKKYGVKFFYFLLPASVMISWIFNYGLFIFLGETLPKYWHAFSYYNFFTQLPVFILGIILYHHVINNLLTSFKSLKVFNFIFASSVILFIISLFINKETNHGLFAGSLLMLSSILAYFIIFLAKYKASFIGRLFVNKLITYVGKISYSMYLTHFAVISLITYLTKDISKSFVIMSSEFTFLVFFLILTFITIIISSFTYRFIEKPGIILGNKLIDRMRG
jgi:peptidoglycan/LPS O-acetylase OafA/YrhL